MLRMATQSRFVTVPRCTRWRRPVIRRFGDNGMPQLQERGAELAVELLEAADQVGHLLPDEIVALLREAADILDGLLHRDVPTDDG
jgi:hypothetical protein